MSKFLSGDKIVIHAVKGFSSGDGEIVCISDAIRNRTCIKKIGAFSAPDLPFELVSGKPAAAVIASPFSEVIEAAENVFKTRRFQVSKRTT